VLGLWSFDVRDGVKFATGFEAWIVSSFSSPLGFEFAVFFAALSIRMKDQVLSLDSFEE
jgi:hypothetical protein